MNPSEPVAPVPTPTAPQPASTPTPVQPVTLPQPAAPTPPPPVTPTPSLDNINYQPLSGVGDKLLGSVFGSWHSLVVLAFVAVAVVGVITKVVFLTFGAVFVSLVWLSVLRGKIRSAAWAAFATANGWSLDPGSAMVPPSLDYGHSERYSDVIVANLAGVSAQIFTYQTTVGSGKNQHTDYYTLSQVIMPKMMPHLHLQPKGLTLHSVHNDVDNGETLKLEGDFDDHYTLTVEKGTEVDALTVMTPDVMSAVIQYGEKLTIEMIGQRLFFIMTRDAETNEKYLRELFSATTTLSDQILENVRLASPTTAPSPTQPTS